MEQLTEEDVQKTLGYDYFTKLGLEAERSVYLNKDGDFSVGYLHDIPYFNFENVLKIHEYLSKKEQS